MRGDLAGRSLAMRSSQRGMIVRFAVLSLLLGAGILMVVMWGLLTFFPIKNAETHGLNNFFAAAAAMSLYFAVRLLFRLATMKSIAGFVFFLA